MRTIFAMLATAVLLGGCYEVDKPIFIEGQRASIAGSYECKGFMSNRRDTIRETSTGLIWKDYRYVNANNDTLTLKQLQGTLYAAQVESNGFYVAFIDVQSPQRFLVQVPDLLSHSRTIDGIANALNIQSSTSARQKDFIKLHGSDDDIATFVTRHTPTLLTTVMDCIRTTS